MAVSATDGFDQDRIAIYFNHDHYVFVALLGLRGKPACLVVEYCFAYVIYLREYILPFLAMSCDLLGSSRGDCAGCSHVVGLAFVDRTFFRV